MAKTLYFSARDASGGFDLWETDGTAAGTSPVGGLKNSGVGGARAIGLSPIAITAFGGGVLFAGQDAGAGAAGVNGLWFSNGAGGGTVEIGGLLSAGVSGAYAGGLSPRSFVTIGAKALFFGADTGNYNGLWATDGTAAGTIEIGGLGNAGVIGRAASWAPTGFVAAGGKAFFNAKDTSGYQGLWVTDGTTAGTVEIGGAANVGVSGAPALAAGGFLASNMIALGSKVVFDAPDSSGATGIWVSDGTAGGTIELIHSTLGGGSKFAAYGSRLLYRATDSSSKASLWITDGTVAGTSEIGGLGNAGIAGAGAAAGMLPDRFAPLGGLMFFTATDSTNTTGIWTTDGTAAGTIEIGGLKNAGVAGMNTFGLGPQAVASLGAKVVFTGWASSGKWGLWVTDGTAGGTFEIGGLDNVGVASANANGLNPSSFTVSGSKAYFNALDSTGALKLWVTDGTLAGTSLIDAAIGGLVASGLVGGDGIARRAHDFAADGMADVLFRNAAGVTYLWSMNDTTVAQGATTSVQVGNNWQIKAVGDFDGNGTSDILWTYNNGANAADGLNGISYVSFQNGAVATGGGVVQQLGAAWQLAGAGDFNGDGRIDTLYRNTSSGQAFLDIMNGASVNWAASGATSAQVTDLNWKIAAIADFNGDGMADVLWRYNNAGNAADGLNGALYEWTMNGTSVTSAGLLSQGAGSAWAVAGTGDFDGDGMADILFRNSANGMTFIDFMNGSTVLPASAPTQWQVDNSWVLGSIGDYNGDGKSDLMWQQSSTGNMYLWDMNGAAVKSGNVTSAQPGAGWTVQNGVLVG